jgi:hypothetical protein
MYQKGSANIIVFIVFLLTLGGAVWYFKGFPMVNVPAWEPKAAETDKIATNNPPMNASSEVEICRELIPKYFNEEGLFLTEFNKKNPKEITGDEEKRYEKKFQELQKQLQNVIVRCQGVTTESVDRDDSSWQTYKNTKYNYEIRYPAGIKVTEKPNFTFAFFVPLAGYKYDGIEIWSAVKNTGVVPEPDFQASSFQEVADYVDKEIAQKQQYKNVIKKVTTLNGYDAIYLSPKDGGRIGGDIFVFHKPHVLHVTYIYPRDVSKQESYKMTQKILSTFKFTQ